MGDIEGMVASMGMTFFCNSLVEGLYYMGENNFVSEELKERCERAIAEFESLKWPKEDKLYSNIKTDLFNTNCNINIFEKICDYYRKSAEQMINKLIKDLTFIISDKPIKEKYQIAEKMQNFFDVFGDYSFYATRDCIRC